MSKTQTLTQSVVTTDVGSISSEDLKNILFSVKGTTFYSMNTETSPATKGKKVDNPFWNSTEGKSRVLKSGCVFGMVGHIYKNVVNNARDKEVLAAAKDCGIDEEELVAFLSKFDKGVIDIKDGEFRPKRHKWAMFVDNPLSDGKSRIIMKNKKVVAAHYKSIKESTLPDGVTLGKEEEFLNLDDIDVDKINLDKVYASGHTSINFEECECRHNEDGKRYIMIWCFGGKDTKYIWDDSRKDLNAQDLEELQDWLKGKTSNAEHQGLNAENEINVRTFDVENVTSAKLNKMEYQVV